MAAPEPLLHDYILHELAASPQRRLDRDEPLFESLLDSTSVLALVSFIEEHFHIQIRDSELVPANFSSLRRLCDFVERKLRESNHAAAAAGLSAESGGSR